MFDKLVGLDTRYNQLSEQMAQPDVATDHVRIQQIAREQRELEDVVLAYREYLASILLSHLYQCESLSTRTNGPVRFSWGQKSKTLPSNLGLNPSRRCQAKLRKFLCYFYLLNQ